MTAMPGRPEAQSDMPADIAIDAVRHGDYDQVVTLFAQLGTAYACDPANPRTREIFNLYVDDDRKHGFVARLNDKIVGVILFEITPVLSSTFAHGRNDGLAVDPSARGRLGARYMVKASDPQVISIYRRMPDLEERGVYFYDRPVN